MTGDKINDVNPIIIEKFDRKGNFTLWQWKMKNVLIQQDLQDAILSGEEVGRNYRCLVEANGRKERGQSQSRHDKSGNKGRSKSKGKEKENKGCFTCGAANHWKKNCKIWKERKAKAMARNSSSASVVTSDEGDRELLVDGIVRVLDKVRHVPKLKKNLISLGILDKVGYKYCFEGGILKIIKGLLVMMKGDIQPNTLYKLRGTTLVGGAAISVEKDKTEL
ncbi:hypothetical protein LWI28_014632 [Acer negundo]|uniref:Retrovirus-related Pol polyprotein from transposon TNT 1-94-like beta-barrel domain-containing protein n=1 Tax=Acer negundo TaxID=4023 RepID=A0AAD5JD55_ACENE|nr:hypothetical protein LWI28_014632 [Acer negundo]